MKMGLFIYFFLFPTLLSANQNLPEGGICCEGIKQPNTSKIKTEAIDKLKLGTLKLTQIQNADLSIPIIIYGQSNTTDVDRLNSLQTQVNKILNQCNIKITFTHATILRNIFPKGVISVANDLITEDVHLALLLNKYLENTLSIQLIPQIDLVGKRTAVDLATSLQMATNKLSRFSNSMFGYIAKTESMPSSLLINNSKADGSTVVHELGHFLKLGHVKTEDNLMYAHNTISRNHKLTFQQCETMRENLKKYKENN